MATPIARTLQTASSWLGVFVFLSAVLLLQGCSHEAEKKLKEGVVGSWEEVHGTRETLQFNADGTLIMKSPRENEVCRYDFPDAKHVRLDCAPAGTPPRPYAWSISVTADDQLLIGNAQEVGTYQRQ
ncbi:MAG: hypothetical protein ABSB66_15580 [Candidatus Acidiferrales bacterium]|jgi:hypothetical protein